MEVSLVFFFIIIITSYDVFFFSLNKSALPVLSEGGGQLHFMNNEKKNDVNNAVPLFGCGSRPAEAAHRVWRGRDVVRVADL